MSYGPALADELVSLAEVEAAADRMADVCLPTPTLDLEASDGGVQILL